jgi:alcohol dehydrogenase
MLGHLIDGTQAEYVRVPFADTSLYAAPEGVNDEDLAMLSDIFPTGYECGVLNGRIKPGDVVAVIGAGPIGLSTLLTAQFYSPSEMIMVDTDEFRLGVSRKLGATYTVNPADENVVERIMSLTGGRGVDVAVEAVGIPQTFEYCEKVIAPGGHIANVGVHGMSVELRLQELWSKNVTIKTRLVDTESTPLLLNALRAGKILPQSLITHRFDLNEIMKAYDAFGNAAKERVLKVIISNRH